MKLVMRAEDNANNDKHVQFVINKIQVVQNVI
jgi:hypothetical protein